MEIAALGLRVDADGVDKAAKSLENLGAQGEKAENAVGGIEKTAAKVQKSLENLGKSGIDAGQSVRKVGDDSSAARSPIDGLGASADRAAQAEARLAEQAERAGMSVGAMKAALRGVPAQFTDIAVSLQGGMSPMTVFLQQGGQLKDMFNGAGNAAQALGSYVIGLVNPFTVAAAAAAALGVAYYQGSKELDALRLAIVTTGNATGVSVTQLRLLAAEMGSVSGSEAKASAALANFVRAGVQGIDTLKDYAQAAVDWEKTTGTSVEKTAKAFASLQEDPLKAAMELQKGMNFLTVATYEQAKAFEDQGKKSEAAAVLQRQYAKTLNDGSSEIKENLGTLERAWEKLGKTSSKVWDLMLGVGRTATLADKISGVREDIAGMERQLAQGTGFGNTGGGAATGRGNSRLTQQDIQALQDRIRLRYEELGVMEKEAQLDKDKAERKAKEKQTVEALSEWNERGLKYLSDSKKLERELNQERELGIRAGQTDQEIQERLNAIREEYAKKNKGSAREITKEISEQAKVYAELAGLTSTYYTELARGQKQYEKGLLTQEQYVKFVEELIQKQPFAIAQAKEEQKILDARVKSYKEDLAVQEKVLTERQRAAAQAAESVQKAKDEEEAHKIAAAAGITHAEAIAQIALARAEDAYQQALNQQADGQTLLSLQKEIDARRELAELMQQKGIRESNTRAAKQMAQDWEKVSQTISRTLSDYIMSGGTDAAVYLKRLFANLVLEPLVQYGVNSLLGGGSAGGAGGSGMGGGIPGLGLLGHSGLFAGTNFGAGLMGGMPALSGGIEMMMGGELLAGGMQAFGAALPYIGAAIAVFSLLKNGFGSRGPNHSGGVASTATQDRAEAARQALGVDAWGNTLGDFTSRGNADIDKKLDQTLKGMLDMYKALAKIGGVNARDIDIAAGFSLNPKHGDEGAMGFFQIIDKATGEILSRFKDREMDTDPQKAWAKFVAEMGGALVTEIKKGDIPGWMKEELDALGDDVTVEGLNAAIQKIAIIDSAFKGWADTVIGFANLTAKAQTELLKFSNGIEALANNVNAFYASFYSEQERAEILQRQVRDQLKKLGIDIDPAGGEAAKKAFRKLIEDALASGNNELAAKLLALAQLFGVAADAAQKSAEVAADAAKTAAEEAARALEEAQQKAKDLAMANFEAAIAREQQYWQAVASNAQEAVQAITGILTPLKQAAKELFGSIESAGQMQAVQGMLYIERAIAGLRGGAKLSSYDGLTDAISAARGGITSGRYASQFERDRDALVLANQLKQIAGYGDTQLSVEERQLKNSQEQLQKLDKTLSYWRDLLDDNKAQIDATLSVEAAIKALEKLMFPDSPGGTGTGIGKDNGGAVLGGGGGGSAPGGSNTPPKYVTPHPDGSGGTFYNPITDPGRVAELDKLAGGYHQFDGTGDAAGLNQWIKDNNLSPKDLADLSGLYESDWEKWFKGSGLPSYDIGTNYVPRDMLAQIHEGEAIVPKAFNPWAGGGGMGSGLELLVQQLLSEAVQSREERRQQAGEIVRLNAQIARLLQRWDGDGLPHEREEVTA